MVDYSGSLNIEEKEKKNKKKAPNLVLEFSSFGIVGQKPLCELGSA